MPSRIGEYTLSKKLGEGFSAKVYLATKDDGSQYALKVFKRDDQFDPRIFNLLKQEYESTLQMDHMHVVKYHELVEQAVKVKDDGTQMEVAYIAQESILGGELFDYVANTGAFSEGICKYYFLQMLRGVHYIHSKGFCHRDLKPENILLNNEYDVKIVDFGFAKQTTGTDNSGFNKSHVGTPGYMSPQVLEGQSYQGQEADLFALGVILFTLYSSHPPFRLANEQDSYYKLIQTSRSDAFWQKHSQSKSTNNFYSEDFKDLITSMLQFNPHQRLDVQDLVGHPWITNGGIASAEAVREEFAERHQVNKKRAHENREQKAETLANNSGARRSVKGVTVDNKTYAMVGEEISQEQASSDVVYLRLKTYKERSNRTHSFFSNLKPDYIFNQLIEKMQEDGQTFVLSDTHWKINIEITKQIEPEEVEDQASDESEEEKAPSYLEQARMQVEILEVAGKEDTYCVDFQRKGGSSILFYDTANTYFEHMEICNNATLDNE